MSLLHHSLQNDDEYQEYGYMLALECHRVTKDMSLFGAMSPVNSKNVQTYFTPSFLHDFLMSYEAKRRVDTLPVDTYQVFLGVFAMEYGVKIQKDDMNRLQGALANSNMKPDRREMIRKALTEYGRTGSLARARRER